MKRAFVNVILRMALWAVALIVGLGIGEWGTNTGNPWLNLVGLALVILSTVKLLAEFVQGVIPDSRM